MNLNCNPSLGALLVRNTQRVRVISEGWFGTEGYCLKCSSPRLDATPASTEFRDFECPRCAQAYELKSAARAHTTVVQDGGFDSMMRRIHAAEAPALMLMHYAQDWSVQRLIAVHPVFLTAAVVRKRPKPHIRPKTRKEYWMCDLDLTRIPPDGKIVVVGEGAARPRAETRRAFQESMRLADVPLAKRGWTTLVLAAVRKLNKPIFRTKDIYAFADWMRAVYPNNTFIEEKIRQQLQELVALDYLERVARGEYRVLR
jgi:type II restriction enzyme